MTVENTKIIELPKFLDARGNLSFIEQNNHIPFEIKRTYWIYDVPGGESRGGHAFKDTEEFIIALSGTMPILKVILSASIIFLRPAFIALTIDKGGCNISCMPLPVPFLAVTKRCHTLLKTG